MALSKTTLLEFKKAFSECYGYEYSDEETAQIAEKLIQLYNEIVQTNYSDSG